MEASDKKNVRTRFLAERHGQWIKTDEWECGARLYKCSECGEMETLGDMHHTLFCPACGADMAGEEDANRTVGEVEENDRKEGHWIPNTDDFTPHKRCSVCGYNKPVAAGENILQEPEAFCNACGAKMKVE